MNAAVQHHIQALVDRETAAWDAQDVEALLTLFHPDMVWAWPPTHHDHDPVDWELRLGRFDRARWGHAWRQLFDSHALIHNQRKTIVIRVSEQEDAAMAVVDVDTLWRHRHSNQEQHWLGRATKLYVKNRVQWQMISHGGLLLYPVEDSP